MSEKNTSESSIDVFEQRRVKLRELREAGWSYPNDFRPANRCAELPGLFEGAGAAETPGDETAAQAAPDPDPVAVSVAGRLLAKRDMGSVLFFRLRDGSGEIQLFVAKKVIEKPSFAEVRSLDIGDIVGASGELFHTRTGELSIRVAELSLLTKNLHPLPEKYHGLTDINLRYRRRYLDLIANREVAEVFAARSRIITAIRGYLRDKGFLEVETPMLQPKPGGAAAQPFITHHKALDLEMFLRVSPELYLKRLLVGGFDKVYELNRNFRNEGLSTRHNPEFTMLEFYECYQDFQGMIRHTQNMFALLADELGRPSIRCGEEDIDLRADFEQIAIEDLVESHHPDLGRSALRNADALARYCRERLADSGEPAEGSDAGAWLMHIYDSSIEHTLIRPTFVTHHPASVSALARVSERDPYVCDRFELVINGQEICNGFSENNDPERQRRVFEEQLENHILAEQLSLSMDEDFLAALEVGMPPAAGQGIGIDRLVMQLVQCASIRDVVFFPQTRPERS